MNGSECLHSPPQALWIKAYPDRARTGMRARGSTDAPGGATFRAGTTSKLKNGGPAKRSPTARDEGVTGSKSRASVALERRACRTPRGHARICARMSAVRAACAVASRSVIVHMDPAGFIGVPSTTGVDVELYAHRSPGSRTRIRKRPRFQRGAAGDPAISPLRPSSNGGSTTPLSVIIAET